MLIVGLGNPGKKYSKTFHNIGFEVTNQLAKELNIKINKKSCEAKVGAQDYFQEQIIIAQPQTYMNNSGYSVEKLVKKYCKSNEDLLVVYDDVDIPVGSLRLRKNGTGGTHNGMKSIINSLRANDFKRLRIGIGVEGVEDLAEFVLSNPNQDIKKQLQKSIEKAVYGIKQYIENRDFEEFLRYIN